MMLKHTTLLLLTLVFAEMMGLGNLVLSNNCEGASVTGEIPLMAVSDTIYVPEVEAEPEEEAEVEEEWSEEWSDYSYDDSYVVYYDYSYDYDDSGELVPYDGSGYYDANLSGAQISGSDLMYYGRMYDDSGYSYTYYSQNVLPGGGLDIPGRHVNDEGYVCDGDGNICVASDDLPYGTVVSVPFGDGTAVVYDSGSGHGNLDVYTSW